jgi:hypothetical protein
MKHSTSLRERMLNLALVLSSLTAYLEWGTDSNTMLWAAEADVLKKLFTDPLSVLHPFTVIPLAGQVILLLNVFIPRPRKAFAYTGIACIGILLLLILFIGIITANFKTIGSVLPFLVTAAIALIYYIRRKGREGG